MNQGLSYDEFVVVAEEEWKIQCDEKDAQPKFSTRIGDFEWRCSFNSLLLCPGSQYQIKLECKELNAGIVEEMQIEVTLYQDQGDASSSYRMMKSTERRLLNGNGYWGAIITCRSILLNIRILKDRSKFPIFTEPNSVGNLISNGKLRVGEKIYHINKQLLGLFSPYFDRLFNGDFVESQQDVIELKDIELAKPIHFEDFLLAFCPPGQMEVLPNRQNVVDLLKLAKYFQMDWLLKKCERHLGLCREMPIEERILLAKKFGMKEFQAKLVKMCSPEESKRINIALLNAFEL